MIIRANQLRVGDVFIKQGMGYIVRRIENKCTISAYSECNGVGLCHCIIGIDSYERVELCSRLMNKVVIRRGKLMAIKYRFPVSELAPADISISVVTTFSDGSIKTIIC